MALPTLSRGKALLAVFCGWHTLALATSGLPDSAVAAALRRPFRWYTDATGMTQDWLMFRTTVHWRAQLELDGELPDGRSVHPWGLQDDMTERQKYLIHSLAVRDQGFRADAVLDAIHYDYPEGERPKSLRIRFTRQDLLPGSGLGPPTVREYHRTW